VTESFWDGRRRAAGEHDSRSSASVPLVFVKSREITSVVLTEIFFCRIGHALVADLRGQGRKTTPGTAAPKGNRLQTLFVLLPDKEST
jgi:hypothetical protein